MPQRKDLLADLAEAELAVEREGARVPFPDTQPDRIRAAPLHLGEAGRNQDWRDALPVPFPDNIQPLDLPRRGAPDTGGGTAPAELGETR